MSARISIHVVLLSSHLFHRHQSSDHCGMRSLKVSRWGQGGGPSSVVVGVASIGSLSHGGIVDVVLSTCRRYILAPHRKSQTLTLLASSTSFLRTVHCLEPSVGISLPSFRKGGEGGEGKRKPQRTAVLLRHLLPRNKSKQNTEVKSNNQRAAVSSLANSARVLYSWSCTGLHICMRHSKPPLLTCDPTVSRTISKPEARNTGKHSHKGRMAGADAQGVITALRVEESIQRPLNITLIC